MMKSIFKIIADGVSDLDAFYCVMKVVQQGKLSKTSRGDQYCFCSVFKNGIEVAVTRSKSGVETFYVRKTSE